MESYTEHNARAMDAWVKDGWEWGIPLSHEAYRAACQGRWDVLLTPQIPVPHSWFAPFLQQDRLPGARLLGLASGGGQQMPVFAALGAACTVLDYSDGQLESERQVARREGYDITVVKADMTRPLPFEDEAFDIIFHPIANCYVEEVLPIWRECHRILAPGGVLLAGMDNGLNYLFGEPDQAAGGPLVVCNTLPYNPLKNKAQYEESLAIDGSIQFSHSLEEQLGGQLKAGLVLEDLYEDRDREGLIARHAPQYFATRARKPL